jgi:hypothetical protein
MKDLNVNSYDLKKAQLILCSLTHAAAAVPAAEKMPPIDEPAYVRLTLDHLPHKAEPAGGAVAEATPEAPAVALEVEPQKFASWESCISWCMSVTKAEAAFVVDSQGFIIASRGRVPGHGFEGTGAELICSVEQLERVAPDAGKLMWVDLDFDKRKIVGFVTPSESSDSYVVGLIAPDPVIHSIKKNITRQILDNLQNLD